MDCVRRMKNFWMLELLVHTLTARLVKVRNGWRYTPTPPISIHDLATNSFNAYMMLDAISC